VGPDVLSIVTAFLQHPEIALSAENQPSDRSLLSGTFAASMERLVRITAKTLDAPAALLALLGDDRRCFVSGSLWREWFAHDTGALIRSGILQRTIDSGGTLALRDARVAEDDLMLRAAAAELSLVSIATAAFARPDGTVLGLICALDHEPRDWTERDLQILADFGQLVAAEQQMRRLLSDRELREQQLRHDSMHDALTGLPNRTLFMKRLSDATHRARRGEDGLFAVLFLDLDGFKLVNDSMGHHVGDELLVTVARRLEACVRGGDIVARLGGDEFAILLERIADARDSAMVAERVQRALMAPLSIGGYDHVTSASIGVALSTGANEQPEYLLRSADIAMYRAKNGGRGRYEMFDRAMHAEALTRLQIESDLRHAFDREEFFLQFQPIILLSDGSVSGVEALVRWRHFERGIVSPATFVPVAEDTGLIVPLGRWVLREACRQARSWQQQFEATRPFTVSVNLSVREFAQPDLARTVAAILEETELPADHLKLEITESAIIGQKHPAIETVEQLRQLGVGIHLDDFGTGYSALSYLHRLPLDAVKVDRAFTSAIDTEERPLHVVRAIISLAHAIGLEVVAEGVATPQQLRLLRSMGCDQAQGFLFARPGDPAEIEALLSKQRTWLD
jgi:diguanylate cyclase (GGDEF)-like protein